MGNCCSAGQPAPETDAQTTLAFSSYHDDLVAGSQDEHVATEPAETLEWLNKAVEIVWPSVSRAVERVVQEEVVPKLRQALPAVTAGISLNLRLGDKKPRLGPIHVHRSANPALQQGPKVQVTVDYKSNIEAELRYGPVSVGIRSIAFRGDLHLSFNPLIDELPVIGGVSVFFTHAPDIQLDFTGLADVADVPGIGRIVRSVIDYVIAQALVLPNRLQIQIGKNCVAPPQVIQLPPIGMLQVEVVKCTGLDEGADLSIVGKAKIEPYVRLQLADQSFDCDIGPNGQPLAGGEKGTHLFAVFDRSQKLKINVFEADLFSSDDLLGQYAPIDLHEALRLSGCSLPLSKGAEAAKAGSLELRFKWLQAMPRDLGDAGCLVVLRIGEISVPGDWELTKVAIRATLGSTVRVTPASPVLKSAVNSTVLDKSMRELKKRLLQQGLDEAKVDAALIQDVAVTEELQKAAIARELWFRLASPSELTSGAMALVLLDEHEREVCTASISLKAIKDAPHFELSDPVFFQVDGKAEKSRAEIDACIRGLRSTKSA